jgi:hypothetical protein
LGTYVAALALATIAFDFNLLAKVADNKPALLWAELAFVQCLVGAAVTLTGALGAFGLNFFYP